MLREVFNSFSHIQHKALDFHIMNGIRVVAIFHLKTPAGIVACDFPEFIVEQELWIQTGYIRAQKSDKIPRGGKGILLSIMIRSTAKLSAPTRHQVQTSS